MSVNRENITWQSEDGTWSIGFWSFYEVRPTDPDEEFDPEWDVEYENDSFFWASTGHRTAAQADAAWDGPNPGGGSRMEYTAEDADYIADLDEYAWAYKNPEAAAKKKADAWRKELADLQAPVREKIAGKNIDEFYGTWQIMVKSGPGYGHMTTQAHPTVKDGWLYIGNYKAYNPATEQFGENIADFKPVTTQRAYGGYRGGYRGW